jgi:hypothetical protein
MSAKSPRWVGSKLKLCINLMTTEPWVGASVPGVGVNVRPTQGDDSLAVCTNAQSQLAMVGCKSLPCTAGVECCTWQLPYCPKLRPCNVLHHIHITNVQNATNEYLLPILHPCALFSVAPAELCAALPRLPAQEPRLI